MFAILASVLAAVVFDVFLGGAHDDRLEAVVMLLVSALMLYMSGWLFVRQNPGAWNANLHRSAERAISSGTSLSLCRDRQPDRTSLDRHGDRLDDGGETDGGLD